MSEKERDRRKPRKVEYAESARSSCKSNIQKEERRLGKMVQSSQFDGFTPVYPRIYYFDLPFSLLFDVYTLQIWNHTNCVLRKAKQIKSLDEVEGHFDGKINKRSESMWRVGGGAVVPLISLLPLPWSMVLKFLKLLVLLAEPDGQGAKGLAWHHANYFLELAPSFTQLEKLSGWGNLSVCDQGAVWALVKNVPSTAKDGTKGEAQENKEMLPHQSNSKADTKCKIVGGVERSKVAKSEGDVLKSKAASVGNSNGLSYEYASDLESKLESQTKELWAA